MSYILDALKKSEQQRGHGTVPGVQTMHSSSLNYRQDKKSYWPYILIIAVILNLVAIIYFITDKNKTADNINAVVDHDPEETSISNTVQTKTPEKDNNQTDPASPIEIIKIKEQAITPQAIASKPANQQSTATNNKTDTDANNTKSPATKSRAEETYTEIIDFYDLPASIKQQLPTITISAHVYSSNPLQRSIVINNNFMEEGEYVLDDLVLHEITKDGAIFNYKGTLFNYGVVSGWQ